MSLGSVSEVELKGEGMLPFFIARIKDRDYNERNILRAGLDVSFKKFEREFDDSDLTVFCAAEGRLKHDKSNKSIIIFSSPGPAHKITYGILKEKFPDYSSIIWRDG
ncbi:uncharacterized protein LOC111707739 [Eurytemora carolleeae]|uniref:uncharacterized protein LOC111707739 n=1 Tax=Eurytemora carolleeae TaxID=1294199 RepID=UPI000C78A797|nr:uncharacterized protein LOC111707739 [Eurytemora carolleeae]|eukprot:XP_023336647.1 uncharacterized protein LOC111707739 [Eurytemora affinis]